MVSGWLITLGLINAYILLLVWLVRSGRMEKWNLSLLLGFILMIRTQRGRGTLAVIAKPRRFWNAFGDVGVVVCFVGMVLMTIMILSVLPFVLDPGSDVDPLGASEILVIPGVNPFVPLWYGLAALIITLVVHEGGHGVLALSNRMRVKNVGLLFAVVPVGAFVEPEEEDMVEAPRRHRLRVYAAGAFVNVVVAAVCLVALSGMAGALEAHEGAALRTVTVDSPAADAGLLPGDIITTANGTTVTDWEQFRGILATHNPGDTLLLETRDGREANATLVSHWYSLEQEVQEMIMANDGDALAWCRLVMGTQHTPTGTECAEALQMRSILGVGPFVSQDEHETLASPLSDLGSFLLYIYLPLGEVRGAPYLSTYLPTFFETPWGGQGYWVLLNTVFWVFWINLMVGLTNILPMLPLDGGHLFRDGMGGVMQRLRPKMDAVRRDRFVGRMAGLVSLLILAAVVLTFIGPRIAGALAGA